MVNWEKGWELRETPPPVTSLLILPTLCSVLGEEVTLHIRIGSETDSLPELFPCKSIHVYFSTKAFGNKIKHCKAHGPKELKVSTETHTKS